MFYKHASHTTCTATYAMRTLGVYFIRNIFFIAAVTKQLSNVTVSNGMAWSPDWTKMSTLILLLLYSFDYESAGTITNQTVAVDYAQDDALGLPDGMCIDAEGMLWVAGCTHHVVTRWDPATGKKLAHIPIPSHCITSCCFGGPNYDKLFVTSALMYAASPTCSSILTQEQCLLWRGLGVCGLPPQKFSDQNITHMTEHSHNSLIEHDLN